MFDEDLLAAAAQVLDACRAKGLRLATAESCTGGLIAGCLTEIAGASLVLERAFVTYSNQAKSEMLGVPEQLLRAHGAVGEEIARAMALGALERSEADITLSCTGIAGPDGATETKPIGLVHIAAARKGGPILHERHQFGDIGRHEVRRRSVEAALKLVAVLLSQGADPASEQPPGTPPPPSPSLETSGDATTRPAATGREVSIRGKDIVLVVLVMAGLAAIGIAVILVFTVVVAITGYGGTGTPLALTFLAYAVVAAAMLGSVYLVLVRRRGLHWSDIGFVAVPRQWIVLSVLTGAALVPGMALAAWALRLSLEESYDRLIAPHGFSWTAMIGTVILLGLLTPAGEEVLFRGLIYRWMRGRWGVAVAVAASSLLFAASHFYYPLAFVPLVAVIGVVLAFAYERSASLWPPIAIHATYNSAGILMVYGSLPQ